MLLSLTSVALLLLSLRSAATGLTFKDTDPVTGASLECDLCPPGTYLRSRCTSTRKSDCAACPRGSFTEVWNYVPKCLRCGACERDQVVKEACTARSDCQCECKPGYYSKGEYEMCHRHSECPVGQGVLRNGTADEDTACQVCANGTFSDTASDRLGCGEHRSCGAGLQLLLRGSAWHDSVCTRCPPQDSQDGADYLREILPVFFLHQKMSVKRLRRIVHRLPTADDRRRGGTAAHHSAAALHGQINVWVASATVAQIRQIPELLAKMGAHGASEKLEAKLQRIDAQLSELCSLRNEVDGVLG